MPGLPQSWPRVRIGAFPHPVLIIVTAAVAGSPERLYAKESNPGSPPEPAASILSDSVRSPGEGSGDPKAPLPSNDDEPRSENTPELDPAGSTPPEYENPNRWGLSAEGSQRRDWLDSNGR